eukprot:PhM_4_TR5161/c0_g1_i4/m.79822
MARKSSSPLSSILIKVFLALACFFVGWKLGGSATSSNTQPQKHDGGDAPIIVSSGGSNAVPRKVGAVKRQPPTPIRRGGENANKKQVIAMLTKESAPQLPDPTFERAEVGGGDDKSNDENTNNDNNEHNTPAVAVPEDDSHEKEKDDMQNPNAKYAKMNGREEALVCPASSDFAYLQIPLKHLPRKKKTSVREKYNRRAHNCGGNGIWNRVTRKDHALILDGIVKMARLKSGSYVFDWGTGCGEKLAFLADKYNVTGFGVDVSELTIQYAKQNTTNRNHYCVADGTRLQWIPSNYFDASISFGSVYHVYNRTAFCYVIREMVRITRPGGAVYNGWTENAEFKREHYASCLRDLPVDVKIHEEREVFQHVPTFPLKSHQEVPNTYSLVVTKSRDTTIEEHAKIPIQCDTHKCWNV